MTHKNKHGLKRDIPDGVCREIRQRCGFGCVVCGAAIYQYHHFDPPYSDAKQHDPNKMVLLCPDCHTRATSGSLSNETIVKAAQHPKCKEVGFSYFGLDIGDQQPRVKLGTVTFERVTSLIEVGAVRFFNVLPPEVSGGPFLLTAYFLNQYGRPIARIERNEWRSISSSWDIELTGTTIAIRERKSDITLIIRADAPRGLIVERMNMWFQGMKFVVEDSGDFVIEGPMCPGNLQKRVRMSDVIIKSGLVGIKMPHGDSSYWREFSDNGEDYNFQVKGDGEGSIDFQYQPVVDGAKLRRTPTISSNKLTGKSTIIISER